MSSAPLSSSSRRMSCRIFPGTRVGLVETVRLFTSEFSMNTDYLLMLSGILAGNGGVIAQIEERYTITATEELGRFAEQATYDLSKSSK